MSTQWEYVLFLENNKWLIHVSRIKEDNLHDLFAECSLLYEFAQIHKPLSIYECHVLDENNDIDNMLNLDLHVKQYMRKYGIEHVRGGSYSANYIPYPYLQTLEHELEIKRIHEATLVLNTLREEYDNISIPVLQSKKEELVISLEKYLEKQARYKFLLTSILESEYETNTVKNIRKEINTMFDWAEYYLRRFELQEPIAETKKEIAEQYKIFLSFYHRFAAVFNTIDCVEKNTTLLPVFITHPEFVFDLFFYHAKPKDISKYTQQFQEAMELFRYFEYMKNTIFNRMQEVEFDISCFSDRFEMETRIAIDYIDLLISTSI